MELTPEQIEAFKDMPIFYTTTSQGQVSTYLIKNIATKTVQALIDNEPDTVVSAMKSHLGCSAGIFKEIQSAQKDKINIRTWVQNQFFNQPVHFVRDFPTPKAVSKDSNVWNCRYLDMSAFINGETPAHDEFTSRLDRPELFMALIGGWYFPENRGLSEIAWLKGINGNDGKSVMVKHLAHIYYGCRDDTKLGILTPTLLSGEGRRFVNAVYENNFVLIYPDNQHNLNLAQSNEIHSWTGGDAVACEGKGKNARFIDGLKRILIASNYSPIIDSGAGNETRRIALICVSPPKERTANWCDKLWQERNFFIYKCIEAYKKVVDQDSGKIKPEYLENIHDSLRSDEEDGIDDFLSKYEFKTEGHTVALTFTNSLKLYCEESTLDYPSTRKRIINRLERNKVKINTLKKINGKPIRVHQGIQKIGCSSNQEASDIFEAIANNNLNKQITI